MKNYEDAFDLGKGKAVQNKVKTFIVGAQKKKGQMVEISNEDLKSPNQPPDKQNIHRGRLGLRLDAVDVIRFQQKVIAFHNDHR